MPSRVFKDYYQILQVHHDASSEVIKAAYRKLCTLYHPDVNTNRSEEAHMMEINEAYHILSDPDRRKEYQKVWLERNGRSFHVFSATRQMGGAQNDAVKNVLDQYFHALYTKNWDNAYFCLTMEDQERIPRDDFYAWRKAISACYDMQDYQMQEYRTFHRCRVGEYIYEEIREFAVTISDLDLHTHKLTRTTTHKYVAYDGISWKVCLGIKNVKQATVKFKLMAKQRQKDSRASDDAKAPDASSDAALRKDPLTGLLSEQSFYEEAEKEAEQYKRRHIPLTLVAFQVHCEDSDKELDALSLCADVIRENNRITDITGRFGNNQIVCLLPDTTEEQAFVAVKKFITMIKEQQKETFQINAGITAYNEAVAIEEAIFAVCSDASDGKNRLFTITPYRAEH